MVDQIITAHLSKLSHIFNKDDICKELCAALYTHNCGRGYVCSGRGYVTIEKSDWLTKVGIELLGQLKNGLKRKNWSISWVASVVFEGE